MPRRTDSSEFHQLQSIKANPSLDVACPTCFKEEHEIIGCLENGGDRSTMREPMGSVWQRGGTGAEHRHSAKNFDTSCRMELRLHLDPASNRDVRRAAVVVVAAHAMLDRGRLANVQNTTAGHI